MEFQPIYPTGSMNIESETQARNAYAEYLRCVQQFGLASEEQFRVAQRVRDLGVLDPTTGQVVLNFVGSITLPQSPVEKSFAAIAP